MKTKFKRYGKRTVSILLSLVMIVSCMILGQIAPLDASAGTVSGGTVIYYQADDNWLSASAKQIVHVWNTSANNDVEAVQVSGNIYSFTLPTGSWTNLQFVRKSPDGNTEWNRSGDLSFPDDSSLNYAYTVKTDMGNSVTWSTYTPYEGEATVYVASNRNSVYAYAWNDTNKLTFLGDYPGTNITSNTVDNSRYNQTVRSVSVDTRADRIIFSNGGSNSADKIGSEDLTLPSNFATVPQIYIEGTGWSNYQLPNVTKISVKTQYGSTVVDGTAAGNIAEFTDSSYSSVKEITATISSGTSLGINAAITTTYNTKSYQFVKWVATDGTLGSADTTASNTFTPTADGAYVTAVYSELVTPTVAWDNTGTDVTSATLSPSTNIKAGDTLTLTFTKKGNISIRSFTFGGQTFTVPWVAGSNTDGTYTFTAPDTLTSSNATLTYTTGELSTYYIDASLLGKYSTYGTMYIKGEDDSDYINVNSISSVQKYQNGFYVSEGQTVSIKLVDNNLNNGTNHGDCEYIIEGFTFSENYYTSANSAPRKDAVTASRSEALASGGYEFTFYPTSSMEVIGTFTEDKGENDSSNITAYEDGTNGRWLLMGSNDAFANKQLLPIMKTVTGRKYVFFDDDLFERIQNESRWWIALTANQNATGKTDIYNSLRNSAGVSKKAVFKLSSDYANEITKWTELQSWSDDYAEVQEREMDDYYFGNFVIKNDYVISLKIELREPDGSVPDTYGPNGKQVMYVITPTVSDDAIAPGSGVNVIAKDGTIRGDYKKYADLADTEIYAINGTTKSNGKIDGISINSKAYDGLSEKAEIPQGREVTIKTTIADGYRDQYYVRAFNINGETYAVNSTVNSNGEYTCTFTIPSDAAAGSKYEITPIYYYNESYSTNSTKNKKFITFYVENFDDAVKNEWGKNKSGTYTSAILACYAWYGTGNDKKDGSDSAKPALGGYPGQPMVYVNGRYEMQVPWYANNGTDVIQGITLNNYVWDYVHSNVLGATTDDDREDINCQTYDYDDFVVLANSMNPQPDYIVFKFKYETTKIPYTGDATTAAKAYGNQPSTGSLNRSEYADGTGNGWEYPFTDYYGNDIDIFNNILTSSQISAGDSETGRFHIVSNGYEENYFGHFATRWYVYAPNGTYIGALPSSALLYYNEEYMEGSSVSRDTVPEDWFMTNAQNTSGNITAALESQKLAFWQVYYDLYKGSTEKGTQSAKGVPVEITYETAIRAEDYNNGGHPRDPALRNDGRWYYSRANATFDANIIVEYKASASDTTYLTDSYVTSANRTAKSNATTLTVDELLGTTDYVSYVVGSKPRFTTDNVNHAAATAIVSNENENLGFRVATQYETTGFKATNNSGNVTIDANTTQSYKFEGWYIKDGDSYTAVNETDIANLTGEVAKLGAVTLVARYVPSTDTVLTITHELYKDADFYADSPYPHNGDGTTAVSIAVTDSNGSVTTQLDSGEISVSLNKSDIDDYKSDSTKYLQITLTTTPTNGKIVDVYRKYKPDGNTADTIGYVSFSNSTQNNGPDTISNWVSASQASADSIKNSTTEQTIVYRIPVPNLYTNGSEEALKTDVIRFYSDITYSSGVGDAELSLNDINVVFKYYDRDTSEAAHSQTEMISTKPTEVTVSLEEQKNVEAAVVEALTIPVKDGSVTGSVSSIGTIMNEYYFWPTQTKAKNGFSGLKNHHDSEALYSASANKGDDSVNLGYHANPYGYIKGETFTYNGTESTYNKQLNKDGTEESIEKWVTYISVDGTREVSETNAISDPGLVGKVIVWGFNQPREYTITFDAPKDGTVLTHNNGNVSLTTHGDYVSIYNDSYAEYSAENKLGDFKGNYNERVGRFYTNAQAVNDLSPYLRAVYGITTASTTAKAGVNSDTSDRTALGQFTTVVEGKTTKYVFDGWYDENDAKVSSDRTFANRITGTQHLTAYYRVDGTDDNSGISVTAGTTEHFISSNGTDYVRYTTEVNAFGYPDNDRNIKDIAIVYVVLPVNNTLTDENIQNIINSAVAESSFRTALAGTHGTARTVTKITVTVEGTTANVTSISYDVVDPGDDATNINTAESTAEVNGGEVKLTNKNRVAFTINFKSESVETGKAYGDIVVFAAITHEDGTDATSIDTSATSDEIIVSSNYVRYKNGEAVTSN